MNNPAKSAALIALILIGALAPNWSQLKINTNFLDLLPRQEHDPLVANAQSKLTDNSLNKVIWLLRGQHHEKTSDDTFSAKSATLEKMLKSATLFRPTEKQKFTRDALFRYRNHLLNQNEVGAIKTNAHALLDTAEGSITGILGAFSLNTFLDDPLSLHSKYLSRLNPSEFTLINGQTPYFRDSEYEYAIFISQTNNAGLDIGAGERLLQLISKAKNWAEANNLKLFVTGAPIFSAQGAANAKSEVEIFGTLSVLIVVCLFLFVFRSPKALLASILCLLVGIVCATTMTFLVFNEIHILTLVFGCSLIGISIDYVLHYQCYDAKNRKAALRYPDALQIGLTIAMATSVIAFSSFLLTPFPALRQIAVFSISGLFAAWFCVIFLLPAASANGQVVNSPQNLWIHGYLAIYTRAMRAVKWPFVVCLILFVIYGFSKLQPNDDIQSLQTINDQRLDEDRLIRQRIPSYWSSQFFLVRADNIRSVLQAERRLLEDLEALVLEKEITATQGLSQVFVAKGEQINNHAMITKHLYTSGIMQSFYRRLGMKESDVAAKTQSILAYKGKHLTIEEWQNAVPSNWQNLWLGCIREQCASIVRVAHFKNQTRLSNIANLHKEVEWVNPTDNLSQIFRRYRTEASWLLATVILVVAAVLTGFFGWLNATNILLIPVTSLLFALAMIGATNGLFSLFNLFALLLVLGISIDYGVFFHLSGDKKVNVLLAVTLAAITSISAFGMLALSSTEVIQAFGVTLLSGVGCAFLIAPLASQDIRQGIFNAQ